MPERTFLPHLCRFVIILLSVAPAVAAQNQSSLAPVNLHQWGAISLFHGLPSDQVRAIAQTPDGLLWFGTDSGLANYDGRRIEKSGFAEVSTARIRTLTVDSSGTLWVGTENGAFRIQSDTITKRIEPLVETQGKAINAIAIGRDVALVSEQGYIFTYSLAAAPRHLATISPQEQPLLNTGANQTPLPLTSIAYANETTMLIGSRGRGLLAIEGNDIKEILSQPRPFFIETIANDADKHLYFGARNLRGDGGIYRSDDSQHSTRLNVDTGTVTFMRSGTDDNLWVGTAERGVFLIKDGKEVAHFTFENTAGGLRSNNIYTVFVDREGVVWFGTDRGVCRYDPKAMRVESLSANAESNFVRTLFQSSDGLVWSGSNRGLFVRSESQWHEVKFFSGKTIHCLNEDPQGRIYVGTASGLYRGETISRPMPDEYLTGSRRFARLETTTNDSIRSLARFQNRMYAATFGRGIERIEETSSVLINGENSMATLQPVSLFADSDNRLLIGTADAGVRSFDGARITTDDRLAPLSDKAVWSITKTADGSLWFATNKGLFALAQNRLIEVLKEADAKHIIPALAVQDNEAANAVWCATAGNGLFKVLLTDSGEPYLAHYDNEQGLPSQKTFALLQARDAANHHSLFIGTNTGIVQYAPGRIAPTVILSRVSSNRIYTEQELQSGIRLEYPQNSLLVDVAAISSRTFPKQFQYAFTLQDEAGKTIMQKFSADSQMVMRDLRSGSYSLICQAFTGDLLASAPAKLNFTVERAPFPFASSALALLLLLALAAIWWGYRQNSKLTRTNTTLATTNQQLAETRMQLANETETERRRIARDLHDQTLADLRRLMILSDRLPVEENADKAVNPGQFRGEIESVSAEIRRICEDLSPSVLENVGLAAALEWALTNAVSQLPEDKKFSYEFNCEEGLEEHLHLAPVMQIHLYRIAQEVLNNISRHAGATHVRLAAKMEANGDFLLRIEDNGCGFDLEKAEKKGRGIANIRSRASLIEALTNWQFGNECGTIFTLRKPSADSYWQSV